MFEPFSSPRRSSRLIKRNPRRSSRLIKRNPRRSSRLIKRNPRRSSRLIKVANLAPPLKKQCLGLPKSGNQGHHDWYPQLESLSHDTTSNQVKPPVDSEQQSEVESEPDYWESSQSENWGSESEREYFIGNQSDEDDEFMGYYDLQDGRKIYIVCLKHRCQEESRCKNILKEIGCEAYFLRLSKTYRRRFYARLTADDATKLECVQGVTCVEDSSLVATMD